MDELCQQIDMKMGEFFAAVQTYQDAQKEMSNKITEGNFKIAEARYSVSNLDWGAHNFEYRDIIHTVEVTPAEDGRLVLNQMTVDEALAKRQSEKSTADTDEQEPFEIVQLRRRKNAPSTAATTTEAAPASDKANDAEESKKDDDEVETETFAEKSQRESDVIAASPLKWFASAHRLPAGLVACQHSYQRALTLAVQAANSLADVRKLESELSALLDAKAQLKAKTAQASSASDPSSGSAAVAAAAQ